MATTKPKAEKKKEQKPLTLNEKMALKEKESSPETEKYKVTIKCYLHGKWQKVGNILNLTTAQAFLFEHQGKIEKVIK